MFRNSAISTMNVDCPRSMTSPAEMREKTSRKGSTSNESHGTYMPACASTTAMPSALISVLLPAALRP